ncbi:hypothetical protein ACQJBY_001807 [Aegilops geniculata]
MATPPPPPPPRVSMWKLSSNNPSVAYWEFKLKVDLTDIWSHQTYKSSMLPQIVPTVALVHPRNAYKVYFFLGQHIFCVNLKKKKLMQFLELDNQELPSLSSLVVHSWNLPAGTTTIHSSAPRCFFLLPPSPARTVVAPATTGTSCRAQSSTTANLSRPHGDCSSSCCSVFIEKNWSPHQ